MDHQLKAFLSPKKILIVDSSEVSCERIFKIISALSGKPENIFKMNDFNSAREFIHRVRPEVVLTEYSLPPGSALELAHEFNKIKTTHSVFIILTGNSLQSIVSEAAEEDIDIYILKPYTTEYFIKRFSKCVMAKMHPSEYSHQINDGKKYLSQKLWDEAIEYFTRVIHSHPSPSLAYYYRSEAEIQKLRYEMAELSLRTGLKYNSVHYKCLTGLFNLLMLRGKLMDAYDVAKKLSDFPLNAKSLSRVVDLAVRTTHYSDIGKYYDVYRSIEVTDPELEKHISAALVVSSKMLFQRGEMLKAASYLKKASVTATRRPKILLEIVTTLAFNDFIPNAKETLEQFSPEERNGVHYLVACAMIAYRENEKSGNHIKILENAIADRVVEPECFYWLIAFFKRSRQLNSADEYLAKALEVWPDKQEYFIKALTAIDKT